MSTVSEVQKIDITRLVTVELSADEFVSVAGDRKPNGGYRVARLVSLSLRYTWRDERWNMGLYETIGGKKEQQKADGTWSLPSFDRWAHIDRALSDELKDRYRPTPTVIVTVTP